MEFGDNKSQMELGVKPHCLEHDSHGVSGIKQAVGSKGSINTRHKYWLGKTISEIEPLFVKLKYEASKIEIDKEKCERIARGIAYHICSWDGDMIKSINRDPALEQWLKREDCELL